MVTLAPIKQRESELYACVCVAVRVRVRVCSTILFLAMLVLLLLLLVGAAQASTRRDNHHAIASAVVRAVELAFAPSDPWTHLLLFTRPFDTSVKTQAVLVAQFVLAMRINNYRTLCHAYGQASAAAAARLAAPPIKLLPAAATPDMAEAACRRSGASDTLATKQVKLLVAVGRLRDVWSTAAQ